MADEGGYLGEKYIPGDPLPGAAESRRAGDFGSAEERAAGGASLVLREAD